MKIYSKLIFVLAAAAMALTACNKEISEYKPGDPDVDGCYGVYFPTQEASGSHTFDPTAEKAISIQVAREVSKGAITVPYVLTSNVDNVFTAGQISFADGQTETSIEVTFPNITIGKESTFSMTITDNQYASKYMEGAISIDCSILCVEWQPILNPKTGEPAVLYFTSPWWGTTRVGTGKFYEVGDTRTVVITCTEEDGMGFYEGYPTDITFYWYPKKTAAWDNGSDESLQAVDVPKNYLGYDYDGWEPKPESQATSPINIFDWYSYFYARGQYSNTADNFYANNNANYPRSYYDGNGGFYLNTQYYIIDLGGWTGNVYDVEIIIDGYVRTDYSLETESDFSVDGILPFYLEAGKDVASIKYAAYEGSLTPTQVANKTAAIADGTDKSEEIIPSEEEFDEEEGKYIIAKGLTLPKTGQYTIVSVAFDADGYNEASSSVEAYYVAEGDIKENEVKLTVSTETTPARYEGYEPYNSFAYYICGKDLTEVHAAILEASKATPTKLAEIKSSDSYAVSEDILKTINAAGGFYTVLSGAKAATEYVVVVWATNGALDKMESAVYKTANMPYEWNSLGKGQLTDDIAASAYSGISNITVSCDVWEEKSNPGLYKISGYQLPLVAAIFGATEEELAEYKGVYWNNTEVVINATDPSCVMIEAQDYGVCLNPSDGFLVLSSIYNGKPFSEGVFSDGAIAFPTKGLLLAYGEDGWYYGNKSGAFKLVLPGIESEPAVAPAPVVNRGQIKNNGQFAVTKTIKYEREPKSVEIKSAPISANASRHKGFRAEAIKKIAE